MHIWLRTCEQIESRFSTRFRTGRFARGAPEPSESKESASHHIRSTVSPMDSRLISFSFFIRSYRIRNRSRADREHHNPQDRTRSKASGISRRKTADRMAVPTKSNHAATRPTREEGAGTQLAELPTNTGQPSKMLAKAAAEPIVRRCSPNRPRNIRFDRTGRGRKTS